MNWDFFFCSIENDDDNNNDDDKGCLGFVWEYNGRCLVLCLRYC